MRLNTRLPVPLVVAALGAAYVTVASSQDHAFTVEDLLSLERIGSITLGWLRMPAATVSPDGRWLSFVVQRARTTRERYSVAGLDGAARADVWVVPATGGTPLNVTHGARVRRGYWGPIWSPDSQQLAMLSTQGDMVQIYVWNRATNTVRRMSERGTDIGYTEITSPNGEVGTMVWKDERHLVAGLLSPGAAGTVLDRARGVQRFAQLQWERAKHGFQATSSEIGSPLDVISRKESIAIIDVSQGAIHEIGAVPSVGRRWVRVAPGWQQGAVLTQVAVERMGAGRPPGPEYETQAGVFTSFNSGITWSDSRSIAELLGWKQDLGFIVSTRDKKLYSLDGASASLQPVSDGVYAAASDREGTKPALSPVAGGQVLTTWRDRVIAKSEDQKGVHLWNCAASKPCNEVIHLNSQIAAIAPATRSLIDYTSATGEALKAVVIEPPGYQRGRAYPTVVWVYAGSVFRNVNDIEASITDTRWDNPQLLAAHGYVVLFPSIPLRPYGTASDPYSDMVAGVIPVVERAVELGIADRGRLGVIGHSYGGYTTLSLLSQTRLFGAAVAMAVTADLLSFYGGLDPRNRYSAGINKGLQTPGLLEISQFRMGAPPWESMDRYLRNSPITYINKIEAPLMLVAGDLDAAMAQSEEVYTGLRRLDKRVSFVRYFGEEHILESPANIRDLWLRLFKWFDENLLEQGHPKQQ